jgi:uncharacterized membrane protein
MIHRQSSVALARAAATTLVALAVVCLAWELAVAPLRPGGSLLALKALPAILPVAGVLQRRRYTLQWSSLLIFGYVAEGLVRTATDIGASRAMAAAELLLALAYFALAVAFLRATSGR